jgi:tetratricopeptide (TPR) repeat protein
MNRPAKEADALSVMLQTVLTDIGDDPSFEEQRREITALTLDPRPSPRTIANCARILIRVGRFDAAEAIYRAATARFGDQLHIGVGLAQIAAGRQRWPEALEYWDRVVARAGRQANPAWLQGRAQVLLKLGRFDEAATVFRGLAQALPENRGARYGLLRALELGGRSEQALREIEHGLLQTWRQVYVIATQIRALIRLGRLDEARAAYREALALARAPAELELLLVQIPNLFEARERPPAWLAVDEILGPLRISPDPHARRLANDLHLRVMLGLRDYPHFAGAIERTPAGDLPEGRHAVMAAIGDVVRAPGFPDRSKTKIFGIGLSRTGTTSTTSALRTLGFNAIHWWNPLTRELISESDIYLFDAFLDVSVSAEFEAYYEKFPNSYFIYTMRPLESWKRSYDVLNERTYCTSDFRILKTQVPRYEAQFAAIGMSLYFNFDSPEEAFRNYDQRVKRFFADKPRNRFLEFDIFAGDGWEKLCPFVQRPIPEQAFPWDNARTPRTAEPTAPAAAEL